MHHYTFSPGVSSFSVIANDVKLYRVRLEGGLVLFHNKFVSDKVQSFGFTFASPLT